MMSSYVAMEILCITNIGPIPTKMIAGVEKITVKLSDCNIFIEDKQKYLTCTGKYYV